MAILAKLSRCLCRSNLGFCFTLIVLSGLAIMTINYIFKPGEEMAAVDYINDPPDGRRLSGLRPHHPHHKIKGKSRSDHEEGPQQTCRIPKLGFFQESHKDVYQPMPQLKCGGEDLFYLKDFVVRVDNEKLNGRTLQKCTYRAIQWWNDTHHVYSKPLVKTENFNLKIKHDFFRVQCSLATDIKARKLLSENRRGERNSVKTKISQNAEDPRMTTVHAGPRMLGSMGMPDPPVIYRKAKNSNKKLGVQLKVADVENDETIIDDKMNFKHKVHRPEFKLGKNQNKLLNEVDRNVDIEDVEDTYEARNQNNRLDEKGVKAFFRDPLQSDAVVDQFMAQVFPKEEVLSRVKEEERRPKSLNMSVLILVVESMSHVCFFHKMPKTRKFLTDTLDGTVMNGYSIVGDSSAGALFPLLTGKNEKELPNLKLKKAGSHFADSLPLIFYDYEQHGYTTLYAEDMPHMGTFNMRFNGFEEVPVDHYMRPFWIAADHSSLNKKSKKYCLGSRPKHQYTLNYIAQFFQQYKIPKFAMAFLAELSQVDTNPIEYLDSDLASMLKNMKSAGELDRTMVVVMGDHGPRHHRVRRTVQGKLEERLPIMIVALPDWFRKEYAPLARNLEVNAERLATPYDVHETLHDLLDTDRTKTLPKYNDRGISLFKELPTNRTCKSAGIDLHWCTCLLYEDVPVKDIHVRQAARELVAKIKALTQQQRRLCLELRLRRVIDAKLIMPKEQLVEYVEKYQPQSLVANFSQVIQLKVKTLQIIVETNPNKGRFEATIEYNTILNTYKVMEDISRINKYGADSQCINTIDPDLRKYCYCPEAYQEDQKGKDEM